MTDWQKKLQELVEAPPVSEQKVGEKVKPADNDEPISVDSEPHPEAGKIVSGT